MYFENRRQFLLRVCLLFLLKMLFYKTVQSTRKEVVVMRRRVKLSALRKELDEIFAEAKGFSSSCLLPASESDLSIIRINIAEKLLNLKQCRHFVSLSL